VQTQFVPFPAKRRETRETCMLTSVCALPQI